MGDSFNTPLQLEAFELNGKGELFPAGGPGNDHVEAAAEGVEAAGEPDPGSIDWDDDGARATLRAPLQRAEADPSSQLEGPGAEAARAATTTTTAASTSHAIGVEAAELAKTLLDKPTSGPGSRGGRGSRGGHGSRGGRGGRGGRGSRGGGAKRGRSTSNGAEAEPSSGAEAEPTGRAKRGGGARRGGGAKRRSIAVQPESSEEMADEDETADEEDGDVSPPSNPGPSNPGPSNPGPSNPGPPIPGLATTAPSASGADEDDGDGLDRWAATGVRTCSMASGFKQRDSVPASQLAEPRGGSGGEEVEDEDYSDVEIDGEEGASKGAATEGKFGCNKCRYEPKGCTACQR